MYNSLNAASAKLAPAGQANCTEAATQARVFDEMRSAIAIGAQAASFALSSLKQTSERLGIQSMYGCTKLQEAPVPTSGEIESTAREMGELIDQLREIRGLAETIDARL